MHRALLGLCALAALALPAPSAAATLHALVIGIDEYEHVPDLAGAVNDARDIADALDGLGAETVLLTDAEATRARIVAEWRAIAGRVAPGDRFIVTFAGHGSHEPEAIPGDEADGRDETWLLPGYAPQGPASGERLRDNDIAELLALTAPGQVILLSDSCHSGSVSRQVSPLLGYRYVRADGRPEDDPLPPPPPRPANAADEFTEIALFLGAVDDSRKVPEFLIDGEARGALSYAFADGLRGAADTDGDGVFTKGEIERHVRRTVRQISQGLQQPQVAPVGAAAAVVLELRDGAAPGPRPQATLRLAGDFDGLPPVTLAGAEATGAEEGGETQFRVAGDRLLSMVGDTVAHLPAEASGRGAALQRAIDKARLVQALEERDTGLLALDFDEGTGLYRAGDRVTIRATGRTRPRLVLFELAPDGAVAPLYPLVMPDLGISDPPTLPLGLELALPLEVTAPFGADHILAVETRGAAPALDALLSDAGATHEPRDLWEALVRAAEADPELSLAIFPFHSAP